MKKVISVFVVAELFVLATYFFSSTAFASAQVAFLSSLFVILGSSFAYKKMVQTQVGSDKVNGEAREGALGQTFEDKRDLLDEIEDPHGLYDDEPINEAPFEELNLKEIVKEERAKIKTFSLSSIKHGARGSVSLFRIVPYVFLALGFVALKNNEILDLSFYLPSLLIGIIIGSLLSKEVVS